MCSLEKLYQILKRWRKPRPPPLSDANTAVERDLGVVITRVRMPSGGEMVVIEKRHSDDDQIGSS